MIKIKLIDDYYLRSDKYQWKLSKHAGQSTLKNGDVVDNWKDLYYCQTVEHCINLLIKQLIRESEAPTLALAKEHAESLRLSLSGSLREAKELDEELNKNVVV